MGFGIVTFLTDFGSEDAFVGLCHAAVLRVAPDARVVDLTHGVRAQDVRQGALRPADCVVHVPEAVHLAVVDPGVGTARRGLVVAAGGSVLVGPDNGLLVPAAEALGGVSGAWELAEQAYRGPSASATFHGRDIFAPAAGHLVAGVAPSAFGPGVDAAELVHIELPGGSVEADRVTAEVRDLDLYGNIQLAVRADALPAAGCLPGDPVAVRVGARAHRACWATAFGDVADGGLAVVSDSFGWVSIAVNGGSAAQRLVVAPGDRIMLEMRDWPAAREGT